MEEIWDNLLGDLYLAPFDRAAAARVAPGLARMLGGNTAALWLLDPITGAPTGRVLTNLADDAMALYASAWHAHDPWTLPLARQRAEGVVRGSELISDNALGLSQFYAEFGRRADMFHVVGSVLPSETSGSVGAIAVQRSLSAGAFEDSEVRLLSRILPHAGAHCN